MGTQVSIGRVLRTHGLRGEVAIARFGDSEDILSIGRTFQVARDSRVLMLTVTSLRHGPKTSWLVGFDGIHDPEAAQVLVGSTLSLDESEMPVPKDGSIYWYQLLGLAVRTEEGLEVGVIDDIFETGANDIYVVNGPLGEVLIPKTQDIVQETNIDQGYMVIRPLPGLLPEES